MNKRIRSLYLSYTFNRGNLAILLISLILIAVVLNLFDFDISNFDYQEDIIYYHRDYLRYAINLTLPIAIVVIVSILAIDYSVNQKKFDLLFVTKVESKDLLKIKIYVYLLLSFFYLSLIYILIMFTGFLRFKYFSFDVDILKIYFMMIFMGIEASILSMIIIRLTRIGYSSILIFILYFVGRIVTDIEEHIGNIIFLNIDLNNMISPLGILPSCAIIVAEILILRFAFAKSEIKIKK